MNLPVLSCPLQKRLAFLMPARSGCSAAPSSPPRTGFPSLSRMMGKKNSAGIPLHFENGIHQVMSSSSSNLAIHTADQGLEVFVRDDVVRTPPDFELKNTHTPLHEGLFLQQE